MAGRSRPPGPGQQQVGAQEIRELVEERRSTAGLEWLVDQRDRAGGPDRAERACDRADDRGPDEEVVHHPDRAAPRAPHVAEGPDEAQHVDDPDAAVISDEEDRAFPGGGIDSCRPVTAAREVRFGARRGYVRLALETGISIVPIATVELADHARGRGLRGDARARSRQGVRRAGTAMAAPTPPSDATRSRTSALFFAWIPTVVQGLGAVLLAVGAGIDATAPRSPTPRAGSTFVHGSPSFFAVPGGGAAAWTGTF